MTKKSTKAAKKESAKSDDRDDKQAILAAATARAARRVEVLDDMTGGSMSKELRTKAQAECDRMFFECLRGGLHDLLVAVRDMGGLVQMDEEGEAREIARKADLAFAEACVDLARIESSFVELAGQR